MSDEPFGSRIAALLHTLAPKAKQPVSATILNNWIGQAEGKLGPEAKGGRLGWLIASSVAIAAVQRAPSTPRVDSCSSSRAARCSSID